MHYIYILESENDGSKYIGITANLKQRIKDHNSGSSKYSKTRKPFSLIWYCAFVNKTKALQFEKYLKHGSGHAFTKKRLI